MDEALQQELTEFIKAKGIADVGFVTLSDTGTECPNAISFVCRLSDAILDEIKGEPTHTYFSHYRAVNAFLDSVQLQTGLFLQSKGYRYITIAASQSINKDGWNYQARYSHKKAACMAGLGTIGKSDLFLHHRFGPRVRLATLLTDAPIGNPPQTPTCTCGACTVCQTMCPSGAIKGVCWEPGMAREALFEPAKCSQHMKKAYQHIGRGAVCGICVQCCPKGKQKI